MMSAFLATLNNVKMHISGQHSKTKVLLAVMKPHDFLQLLLFSINTLLTVSRRAPLTLYNRKLRTEFKDPHSYNISRGGRGRRITERERERE